MGIDSKHTEVRGMMATMMAGGDLLARRTYMATYRGAPPIGRHANKRC